MNPTKEQVEAVDLSVEGALRVNAYARSGKANTLKWSSQKTEFKAR